MKRVLLVTSESEFYYRKPFLVAAKQYAEELEILLFDVTGYPEKGHFSVKQSGNGVISGEIEVCRLGLEDDIVSRNVVDIGSIQLAWSLRAGDPVVSRQKSQMESVFAIDESVRALNALYRVAPWRWVTQERQSAL